MVHGVDNLNDYYDVGLKKSRLELIAGNSRFTFHKLDIEGQMEMSALFEKEKFDVVVHLAAQAGVRYSIQNPHAYISSNIQGFMNVLEGCRHHKVKHLIYASSSSVYGANKSMPFTVSDNVDHPVSLYAATKKSNELMAHCYSSLYQLPTTGLRFFTVYGPWGRPDMALFLFTKAIIEGKPIQVFNYGKMKRDFTFVDDIAESIFRLLDKIPEPNNQWTGLEPDPATSYAPYRIFNIGNHQPVALSHFIELIEQALGKKAIRNLLPMQDGDVAETYADVKALSAVTGFKPATTIEDGIDQFVRWYRDYYKV